MLYALLYLLLGIVTTFGFGQFFARCDAEADADQLRLQLQDAIDVQLDQYEELEQLRPALAAAVHERNEANLRAQRAINSVRALPIMKLVHALPDEHTGVVDINLN